MLLSHLARRLVDEAHAKSEAPEGWVKPWATRKKGEKRPDWDFFRYTRLLHPHVVSKSPTAVWDERWASMACRTRQSAWGARWTTPPWWWERPPGDECDERDRGDRDFFGFGMFGVF